MGTCLCPARKECESKLLVSRPRRTSVISGMSALRQRLRTRNSLTRNDAVQRYGETTAEGGWRRYGRQEYPARDASSRQGAFPQQYSVYCKGKATRYWAGRSDGHRSRLCRHHPKASPSPSAAMVRAWSRQRRVFHSTRSLGRRDHRTRAAEALRPSSAAMCPPPRRSKLRIVRFRACAKAHSLRCSSSSNRIRFAGLRFENDEGALWLQCGFILTRITS